MRIRLRVPKDDEKQGGQEAAGGVRGWLHSWLYPDSAGPSDAPPVPGPAVKPAATDRRWVTFGDARYFVLGRLCRWRDGAWETEYLFDVRRDVRAQVFRIVLPEPLVQMWERTYDQRMTEAARLGVVRETLLGLMELDRWPTSITVTGEAVAVVDPKK